MRLENESQCPTDLHICPSRDPTSPFRCNNTKPCKYSMQRKGEPKYCGKPQYYKTDEEWRAAESKS